MAVVAFVVGIRESLLSPTVSEGAQRVPEPVEDPLGAPRIPADDVFDPATGSEPSGAAYGPDGEGAEDPIDRLLRRVSEADLASPSTRNAFEKLAGRLAEKGGAEASGEILDLVGQALDATAALDEDVPFGRSVEHAVKQLANAASKKNPEVLRRLVARLGLPGEAGTGPVELPVTPPVTPPVEPETPVPGDPGSETVEPGTLATLNRVA